MNTKNNSPFKLANTKAYLQWRDTKLNKSKTNKDKRVIALKRTPPPFLPVLPNNRLNIDISNTYPIDTILSECTTDNYCLYSIEDYQNHDHDETKLLINSLTRDLSLSRLDDNLCSDKDSLTSICRTAHRGQHEYIPYTNKKLSWHTDGYYNLPENTIYSMLLHCFKAANSGGESAFIDHEIAYLLMRDENPKWIEALNQDDVLTIPANILNGKVIRAEQTGPVFSLSPMGRLHMRYSARQKNIVWKQNKEVLGAIEFLQNLLNSESKYIVRHKLKEGEGIISRNILHCRSAFDEESSTQGQKSSASGRESSTSGRESSTSGKKPSTSSISEQRLLFRGRFYDEIPSSIVNQNV